MFWSSFSAREAAQTLNGGFFYKALIYSALEFAGGAAAAGIFKVTHSVDVDLPEEKVTA